MTRTAILRCTRTSVRMGGWRPLAGGCARPRRAVRRCFRARGWCNPERRRRERCLRRARDTEGSPTSAAAPCGRGSCTRHRPRISVGARAGALVEPHAGTWAGGWKPVANYRTLDGGNSGGRAPAFDVLNVEACRTASGQGCVNLSPQGEEVAFSSRAVRLAAGVTGRYLIAFDQRSSPDQAIAGVGYSNPAAIPVVNPGTTVSHSAARGPITGPPPPRVRVLQHAISRPSTVIVGRVRCSTRCRVQTFITSRRGAAGSNQTIQGAHWIAVPRHQLTAGTLSVEIDASDGHGVRGTSHLSSGGDPGPSHRHDPKARQPHPSDPPSAAAGAPLLLPDNLPAKRQSKRRPTRSCEQNSRCSVATGGCSALVGVYAAMFAAAQRQIVAGVHPRDFLPALLRTADEASDLLQRGNHGRHSRAPMMRSARALAYWARSVSGWVSR